MAMVTEFVAAINQICSERSIDANAVFEALEDAVAAAYKREYSEEGDVDVEMSREDGTFKVILKKLVVDKVEDEALEISLKKAQKIEAGFEVGDTLEIEQEVEDFGRIAAQTAKQVIMQKIRESEKDAILSEYSEKVGEIFPAMMHRMQGGSAVFEIGKAVAYMPPEQQVQSEFYRLGDRYKVLLQSIEDNQRGRALIVTRSAPEFLMGLFHLEVPEIASGVVEIKGCAREAGSRSKMAVTSHQDGVDPIGSCVGQRGIRIANVMSELGDEKIDVIEWKEDIEEFVEKALSPAQVLSVSVTESVATVRVAEDQLSLAIGKDGQNVRLAAKLTGLKIDIQGPDGKITGRASATQEVEADEEAVDSVTSEVAESVVADEKAEVAEVNTELSSAILKKIEKAGKTLEELKGLSTEELVALEGIGKATAEKIISALK